MVGTGQRGGFVQDSVCGDFKSPNPYNPALQGASGMQLLGRTSWMARCTPKPWAAAWVLQPPYGPHVRGGPALSLGLARSIPEPPPPPCLADSRAARRTPAESLLAPAPAQPSREHGGDLPAAPARCWICGAGGDVQTHNGRGDAAPPGTKLSPASPDPRETVFRSLSSTKGCAQRPGAAGSWWEREVGPAWGHRCPAEPPRGALSMPSVHPGYHYWGRGGRSEKVQGEQWAAGTGEALGKVK